MHTALTVVYLTYPLVVSDIDISCSIVNKVRHYIIIAFLSCQVQGSVLLKRMQQNVMFTIKEQNYFVLVFKPISRGFTLSKAWLPS